MNLIDAVVGCLGGRPGKAVKPINEKTSANYTDEDRRTEQDIVGDVLNILCNAEKNGRDLERTLQNTVGEYGWTENIAKGTLYGLEKIIKTGASVGQAMKEAIKKATSAAVEFAREHPVYATLIALGVLALLMPWAIEWLGFSELGPVEGTFAAWWQARYAGYVPKGSLFSYFQRLGMT
ncbi:MAG: hypothetical protein M1813_007739 [Trichoglossum hirsutum]|nr:MAG: hypothetical protein M1813_007739 [Trichoglossum hirsutum]